MTKSIPDPKQLPYLIKLLEDESPVVRENVLQQLLLFGCGLDRELDRQSIILSKGYKKEIHRLLTDSRRQWLRTHWQSWKDISDDKQQLETALTLLGQFLTNASTNIQLKEFLDQLTQEFSHTPQPHDARALAHFLFQEKGLRGIDSESYYNVQNSSLVYTIESKRGIPISLSCIYILVGSRIGLSIEGCNFPGHFLTTAVIDDQKVIVDCFHGGIILDDATIKSLRLPKPITLKDLVSLECNTELIISRVLRNLIKAYEYLNDTENINLMTELLSSIEEEGGNEDAN